MNRTYQSKNGGSLKFTILDHLREEKDGVFKSRRMVKIEKRGVGKKLINGKEID